MLIPIFKPGDVLLSKNYPDEGKLLVVRSRTKSETTEYTTDMDIGCGVTRHEIKTSEWIEYDVLTKDFRFGTVAEDDVLRWYRRINHVDLSYDFAKAENEEKDEEIRKAREAIEFYKDQLRDCRRDYCILQDKVKEFKADDLAMRKQISMLKDDNSKLVSKNERLVIRQQELEQCAEVGAAYDKAIATGKINSLIDTVQGLRKENDKLSKEVDDLNNQLKMAYGCIDRFTIDAVAGMRRAGCSVEKIAKTLNMPEQAVRVYLNAADVLDCKEEE